MESCVDFLNGQVCFYSEWRERGGNPIFEAERDYQQYLRLLKKCKVQHKIKVFAFCLIPEAIQVVSLPDREQAGHRFFRDLHQEYIQFSRARYPSRNIRLYPCRKYRIQNDVELFNRIKYVECSPVEEMVSSTLSGYPWSSFSYRVLGNSSLLLDRI